MTVQLKGRIDSSNATQTEAEIKEQIGGIEGELILDAGELEYISSAGLRVILRLKKENKSAKVINCKAEVYEIFDMTGFTEMMEISKAYRQLSVDGCEVIGEGANGLVYRIDADTIIKVYKNPDSLDEIHNERELARKAFVMGIPTAIPYDVVKVGELYGSVFEMLNAKSFCKLLIANPDSADELAKESVEILKTIHSTELKEGELPDKKAEAVMWAEACEVHLSEPTYTRLVQMVRDIPTCNTMLHGDYHIKNIMKQNGENLLIDMDTLSMGHPIFEFTSIFLAYEGFGCINTHAITDFFGISLQAAEDFLAATLKYYFVGKDEAFIRQIKTKAAIIGYARLLRRTAKRYAADDPYAKELIAYCVNYLEENVGSVASLYY